MAVVREFWDLLTNTGVRLWEQLIGVWAAVGAFVLAALAWAGRTWFQSAQKRKDRGRELVEKAYPEMAPLGNLGPRGQFCSPDDSGESFNNLSDISMPCHHRAPVGSVLASLLKILRRIPAHS